MEIGRRTSLTHSVNSSFLPFWKKGGGGGGRAAYYYYSFCASFSVKTTTTIIISWRVFLSRWPLCSTAVNVEEEPNEPETNLGRRPRNPSSGTTTSSAQYDHQRYGLLDVEDAWENSQLLRARARLRTHRQDEDMADNGREGMRRKN